MLVGTCSLKLILLILIINWTCGACNENKLVFLFVSFVDSFSERVNMLHGHLLMVMRWTMSLFLLTGWSPISEKSTALTNLFMLMDLSWTLKEESWKVCYQLYVPWIEDLNSTTSPLGSLTWPMFLIDKISNIFCFLV